MAKFKMAVFTKHAYPCPNLNGGLTKQQLNLSMNE